jgi:GNAT superfamily N-acetyltransferase
MPDMLVKLYELPELEPALRRAGDTGAALRRARTPEGPRVAAWMREHFPFWLSEVEAAFHRSPLSCFLAARGSDLVGFACYDAFCPNFFGPTGVLERERGKGIGQALLLAALHAQKAQGYAYAIIGGVGPVEFYERCVGAVVIPGSDPGMYSDLLV